MERQPSSPPSSCAGEAWHPGEPWGPSDWIWERKRDSPARQAFSIVRGRMKEEGSQERGPVCRGQGALLQALPARHALRVRQHFCRVGLPIAPIAQGRHRLHGLPKALRL